ncbi:hypothetical protein [Dasania marina]|uniref:hypothetical protein n=1 Tax=Dasania marina TaxID=471499 RepID=UPI00036CCF19|nr:hypothetical protein [Dasania marina]
MPKPITTQITTMQTMAKSGNKISEILSYLAQQEGIEEQLVLMERCRDAFNCSLGNVTAIGAWWHDNSCELDNDALDAYIGYVLTDYLAGNSSS